MADSMEECITKLQKWKAAMESKGLRVNMKKTKFLVSGIGLDEMRRTLGSTLVLSDAAA